MQYTNEDKLKFECEKLEHEIKTMKRPFYRVPGTWFAAIPLIFSIGASYLQYNDNKSVQREAEIKHQLTLLNIEKSGRINDSLKNVRNELEVRIPLAKAQLQGVLDSVEGVTKQLQAYADNMTASTPQAQKAIENIQHTVSNLSKAGKYAVANIDVRNATFKVSPVKNDLLAKQKEKEGFSALVKGEYDIAATAFTDAENAYNGYHNVYELARLLKSKAGNVQDPERKKELLKIIVAKYAAYAAPEVVEALKKQIDNLP